MMVRRQQPGQIRGFLCAPVCAACAGGSGRPDVVVEEDGVDVEVRLQRRPAEGLAGTGLKASRDPNQTEAEKRLTLLSSKRLAES